eukprot:TRINITY_DN4070_c0_g1_i16.p1 TRINITY_DN4070_c0_g1~~TRINITY_DN4070_c0_g1_i16.p1  ORF type:complete len:929 (-),score=262.74 TRINITY_DN4070_c0_g1_i16:358-3144(-)
MLRSLVGSEMCIRDRYQRRVRGTSQAHAMHSLIHVILKKLVLTKWGQQYWDSIGQELDLDTGTAGWDEGILERKQHDDSVTIAICHATSKVLGLSWDDLLRVFGGYFVTYLHMANNLRLLRSMGDTLTGFMENINHLHHNLERSPAFRETNFPLFGIRDKTSQGEDESFTLSYSSVRGATLAPLVEGVLPEAAKLLHKQEVEMERVAVAEDGWHATWLVRTTPLKTIPTRQSNPTRQSYEAELTNVDPALLQRSTVTYLIDKFALRLAGEKAAHEEAKPKVEAPSPLPKALNDNDGLGREGFAVLRTQEQMGAMDIRFLDGLADEGMAGALYTPRKKKFRQVPGVTELALSDDDADLAASSGRLNPVPQRRTPVEPTPADKSEAHEVCRNWHGHLFLNMAKPRKPCQTNTPTTSILDAKSTELCTAQAAILDKTQQRMALQRKRLDLEQEMQAVRSQIKSLDGEIAGATGTVDQLMQPCTAPQTRLPPTPRRRRRRSQPPFPLVHLKQVLEFHLSPAPTKPQAAPQVVMHSTAPISQEMAMSIDPTLKIELDQLHAGVEVAVRATRSAGEDVGAALGSLLMRGVPATSVSAAWDQLGALDAASKFWGSNDADAMDYWKSSSTEGVTRFVSHPWQPPEDWNSVMGSCCQYSDIKATELNIVALDLANSLNVPLDDITFWIDKACIPQRHALMPLCVELIEEFLKRSDGMVVLLTWEYFQRLWCVYEWATFLIHHDPKSIDICVTGFLRPGNAHLFLQSIEEFSIDAAKCAHEPDREMLKAKVAQYYTSEKAFEDFAKSTAIGLIAVTAVRKAARKEQMDENNGLQPWVELAERLGFAALASALTKAEPEKWRDEALAASNNPPMTLGKSARGWQTTFEARLQQWFEAEICPALDTIKRQCARLEQLPSKLAVHQQAALSTLLRRHRCPV